MSTFIRRTNSFTILGELGDSFLFSPKFYSNIMSANDGDSD